MLRYALIAAIALAATPAAAQDFLKGLARSAAEAAVRGAVNRAVASGLQAPDEAPDRGSEREAPAEVTETSAKSTASNETKTVFDIPKPADHAARREALDQFSRYSCDACEGGWAYDSWPAHGLNLVGHNKLQDLIGAMEVGKSVSWKGRAANGKGTITAAVEKLGMPCKQVTWTMTKGQQSVDREGLFCYGYSSRYSATQTWVEVY